KTTTTCPSSCSVSSLLPFYREVENIQRLASNQVDDRAGRLSIATTHTQARYVLPDVISRFRERYPNVTLDLHQGTSEQIAEMVSGRKIDFAIATGSRHLFSDLVLLPCYHWDRSIIVPKEHELASSEHVSIHELATFPLVTYVFSFDGHSSLRSAFEQEGLKPDVVFTARDADVIKTYVRMGLGVGIVAAMAQECQETSGLVALDASHLFPRSTTWIGFPKDTILRNYMIDFIEIFAPHLEPRITKEAALAADQQSIDAMVSDIHLPRRGKCAQIIEG
ncbi:MAG: LysR substrate-binding domain-containing protein, partial [Pseudomonadota bacterium]